MSDTERLGFLDGLRGVAILQVVWFHLWIMQHVAAPVRWLDFIPETGNFGVHLFFFLSGFLIVHPFLRAEANGTPAPRWRHFAWRRFIKIVPSYVLSIAIAYATGFAIVERGHATVAQELWSHALFLYTLWPSLAVTVNGVYWTLAIEVQFYLLFPVIWRAFKSWPWPTGLGLIALSLALRLWRADVFSPDVVNVLSGNLPNFIDLFACGMLCAWCYVRVGPSLSRGFERFGVPLPALAGGSVLIITLAELAGRHLLYPSAYLHEALGAAFAVLTFAALVSGGRWTAVLSNPFLRFFATISYNLYLYNWMIIYGFRKLPTTAFIVSTLTVSIIAGTLVTYCVERPLLRLPDPGRGKKPLLPART